LFGEAMLCIDLCRPHAPWSVLKRIDLLALEQNLHHAPEDPFAELDIIARLQRAGKNNHVVSFVDTFCNNGNLYIGMEYCRDGDLYDFLEKQSKNRVNEIEALALVKQIAKGLAFLHQNDIAHRDLSVENVLLHNGTAKLCDFGLAVPVTDDSKYIEKVGKAFYMAPEVASVNLTGTPYDAKQADIWSLGIIMFILLTGSPLVSGDASTPTTLSIVRTFGVGTILDLWQMRHLFTESTVNLLNRMLQVDPSQRATIEEVLSHPALV
jgi:serine/threonine protein kinase